MTKFISFDMDGTLIGPEFTDWVWGHGIPVLYAEKRGLSFEEARTYVQAEYRKVGEGAIEWYDIKYWFRFFELNGHWKQLMKQHADKIRVYPDVDGTLSFLKERFPLVLRPMQPENLSDWRWGSPAWASILTKSFRQLLTSAK